jgi:RNA polymerase sigma-70 factor (ECF subfamily)
MSRPSSAHLGPHASRGSSVVRLPVAETDVALVAALRAGRRDGAEALFDRYGAHVHRVLQRVMGPDQDLNDLVQDVFVAAFEAVDKLQDPSALRAWLSQIAVYTARGKIRRRVRWRLLTFRPLHELDEFHAPRHDGDVTEAVRATYRVLDRLPADERIAFALRFIEGMELTEVARATDVSLATVKRRLARAQRNFLELSAAEPSLAEWTGGNA